MKNFSLTKKILIMTTSMLFLFGIITTLFFKTLVSKIENQTNKNLLSSVENLNHQITAQYYERYGDVQSFAINPIIKYNLSNQLTETLNKYVENYGIYDLIIITDLNGKLIGSNSKSATGTYLKFEGVTPPDFSKEDWFLDLKSNKEIKDNENLLTGSIVKNPKYENWIEKLYNEKRFTNVFATVIRNEKNEPIRYIANYANFQWLNFELKSYSQNLKNNGYNSAEISVINEEGKNFVQFKESINKNEEFKFNQFSTSNNILNEKLKTEKSGVFEDYNKKEYLSFIKLNGDKFSEGLNWSLSITLPQSEVLGSLQSNISWYYISLFTCLIILTLFSYYFSNIISKEISLLILKINNSVKSAKESEVILNESNHKILKISEDQTRMTQLSVSAIAEIGSMIIQTNDSTKVALDSTNEVYDRSITGREIMGKMTESMAAIEDSNQSLQEIANIISNISEKTNVINDIVFKTQLLSFNASIEAARAGQYGKGFAVVAEEVGNLAQMSGIASNEISSLILDSEKKVQNTLEHIRKRVKEGKIVSDEASLAFNGIVQNVENIQNQVKSIFEASAQQEIGIQQSQSAMTTLEENSLSLKTTAESLNSVIQTSNQNNDELLYIHKEFQRIISDSKNELNKSKNDKKINTSKVFTKKIKTEHEINELHKEKISQMKVEEISNRLENITADDESFKKIA